MKRRGIATVLALLTLAGLGVSGCRRGLPSREKEIEVGRQFEQDYAKKPDGPFITRGPEYDRIQKIAARMLPLARADWDVPYRVYVVESKEINAFAVPGGPIYFYTGLIQLAASDDEIASVLGHEISHVTKRHSMKQLAKRQDAATLLAAADALIKGGNSVKSAAGAYAGIKMLEFSRGDESQADEYGFKYLVRAGYKPDAMADFFEKMQQKSGGTSKVDKALSFLSTHPVTESRIKTARKRAADYKKGTYKAP